MNRCPITLEPCGKLKYSLNGLHSLSRRLDELHDFPFTKQEQLEQAALLATKLSIQGVQPKLSVKLNSKAKCFEIVDRGGTFIIKPTHPFYPELVENEDVSMRLAAACKIKVPIHGMIYAKDGSLSYFIKRFDRYGRGQRLAVEDFAQLSSHSRDTKYDSSMEQVALIIEKFCSFPMVEKLKLFRLTLFNFLIGNEDMHLKNFSLISKQNIVELSPAYDLLNSSIALKTKEELALPLMGKKSGLNATHFIDYFAKERLLLPDLLIKREVEMFESITPTWENILVNSFLSTSMQEKYLRLVHERHKRIFA